MLGLFCISRCAPELQAMTQSHCPGCRYPHTTSSTSPAWTQTSRGQCKGKGHEQHWWTGELPLDGVDGAARREEYGKGCMSSPQPHSAACHKWDNGSLCQTATRYELGGVCGMTERACHDPYGVELADALLRRLLVHWLFIYSDSGGVFSDSLHSTPSVYSFLLSFSDFSQSEHMVLLIYIKSFSIPRSRLLGMVSGTTPAAPASQNIHLTFPQITLKSYFLLNIWFDISTKRKMIPVLNDDFFFCFFKTVFIVSMNYKPQCYYFQGFIWNFIIIFGHGIWAGTSILVILQDFWASVKMIVWTDP